MDAKNAQMDAAVLRAVKARMNLRMNCSGCSKIITLWEAHTRINSQGAPVYCCSQACLDTALA